MSAFCVLNSFEIIAILLFLAALSLLIGRFFDRFVSYTLLAWTICEIIIAVTQITGIIESNNDLFLCTGSFFNSGPFAGFLAISGSVLLPYSFVCENRFIKKAIYAVALLLVPLIFFLQSRAAVLSLLVCGFIFSLTRKEYRLWIKGHWLLLLLCTGVVFCILYFVKRPSADGRLFIDRISVRIMKSNGFKGLDEGNYAGAYGEEQYKYFAGQSAPDKDILNWEELDENERMTADCPDYSFNEFLWIGVEYGVIPLLLFIALLVLSIFCSLKKNMPWFYGTVAFSVFAFFSYPLHTVQIQIVLCFLLIAGFYKTDVKNIWLKGTFILSLSFMVLGFELLHDPKYNATVRHDWKETKRWYMLSEYEYVTEGCDTLLEYKKDDKDFLFIYGRSLNITGDYRKSDSILELGTHVSSDPMFWNVMGNNSLEQEKYREAEERYRHAFYMVPNRLYPLYLLAQLYHTEGDTVRFTEMADRVESFRCKVESAQTEQLRDEIRELRAGY